tara:strand:- start:3865 stop:5745 length:1881 start_codon:yes stop_codon:yes gene_type:complete
MTAALKEPKFKFRELSNTEGTLQNIRLDNFINSDKDELDTFVREYFQNLRDARKGESPAVTNIRILSQKDYDYKYLAGLTKELEHPLNLKIDKLNKNILILEEEGTTGLTGSLEIHDAGSDHNGFWHNVGQNEEGKLSSSTKSGSAGQGNIIYFGISSIFTVFAYTNRINSSSHQEYIMGKSELPKWWHKKGDEKTRYHYEGFWGNHNKKAIPVTETAKINQFKNAFKLQRDFSESGISFVIPFLDGEFSEVALLKSIIKECFYSILLGHIEINIAGEKLTKHSIMDIANRVLPEESDYRDFLCDTVTINDQEIINVKESWIEDVNKEGISEQHFEDLQLLAKLKDDFADKKVIAINFPIEIKEKNKKTANKSYFKFFITSNCEKEDKGIIRNGIPISNEPKKKILGANFRSLILIGTDELGTYCKRAETPNHTEFDPKRKSFKDKYARDTHFPALRGISGAVAKFFIGIEDKLNQEKLKSLLSVDVLDIGDNFKRPKRNKKKIISKPTRPSINYGKHEYFIIKEGNGWSMENGQDSLTSIPCKVDLTFEIAEEGSANNKKPKDYDPTDFNFGFTKDWLINTSGINILSQNFNKISIEITQDTFFIEVQNSSFFDKYDVVSAATII